ncbi:antibiotic biosynthesis monooxygenase [Breoghania sp.]|uniref:putative quinol monooxygenase n=1 Tax=Breoghania sp. TaxID=2065378 RepID=UPI002AA7A00C|nr:antibiotic biosynthesis monooxygenase [Breoghania sp.]
MSEHVHWVLEVELKANADSDLRALMLEMVGATKADEPGALNYEWYFNEAGTVCHIYERYASSDAALIHLGNFGTKFASRFLGLVRPTRMTVYGPADEKLRSALAQMNATFMDEVGGFTR